MSQVYDTPKALFRSTQITTSALMAGLVFMSLAIHFFAMKDKAENADFPWYLLLLVAFLAGGGIIVGAQLFRKKLMAIDHSDLMNKLHHYRVGLLIKYALLEFPAILAIVFYFLSGDYQYMIVVLFLVVIMFINRPSVEQAQAMLGLSEKEANQLR